MQAILQTENFNFETRIHGRAQFLSPQPRPKAGFGCPCPDVWLSIEGLVLLLSSDLGAIQTVRVQPLGWLLWRPAVGYRMLASVSVVPLTIMCQPSSHTHHTPAMSGTSGSGSGGDAGNKGGARVRFGGGLTAEDREGANNECVGVYVLGVGLGDLIDRS